MNRHQRDIRKIDRSKGAGLLDGTPNLADRAEIGPTLPPFPEWEATGLALPDLPRTRTCRWRRLVDGIVAPGYRRLMLTDPMNIRYATGSTNMQLWNTHTPFREALVCADGHIVIWDWDNGMFLSMS